MDPLLVGGGALLAYLFLSKKSDPVASLTDQAMAIAQQNIDSGVPVSQAINHAAASVVAVSQNQPPPPSPLQYSSISTPTAPSGPIISLNDPRISAAIANKDAMFGAEISAVGMPIDVRNALVSQGWTWTGSVFNPGGLYPPGTDPSKIIIAA
jgi:hypothetical protein